MGPAAKRIERDEMTEQGTGSGGASTTALSPEQWYDLIVEASADGSWFYDMDRERIHYSPSLSNMLDFPMDKGYLTPRDFISRVHPEDREHYRRTLGRYLKGETGVFQAELRVVNDSGDWRWILSRGIARRDGAGHAYCMFGSIVDITQRRQLEDSLRTVALSTTEGAGPDFFGSLVRYLAEALNADFSLVSRLDEAQEERVETIAVYRDGGLTSNFSYDLGTSPCGNVLEQRICAYPDSVARLFPADRMLVDEGIEAYIGSPLVDSAGRAIGIIAALFRRPVAETSMAEDLLRIFAARAAAELERQAKVEALRESEQRFRDFAEVAADIFWNMDTELRFNYFNEQCYERLALEPGQLLGKTLWELVRQEGSNTVEWERLRNVLESRRSFRDSIYTLIDGHGNRRHMRLSGRPVFDAETGAFEGYRGVATEITEQRRAEAEYRGIFNNTTEGIFRTLPDGRLLRANPALVEMHGFQTEEELIESVSDLATEWYVDPDDRARLLERLAGDGQVIHFETQMYRRATGERIWVSENARAVYGEDGEIEYYEGSVRDITAEHKARELARHRNTVLEMIARGAPVADVMHEIVAITEEQQEGLVAIVLKLEDGRLYCAAAPGLPGDCVGAIHGAHPAELGGELEAAARGRIQPVDSGIEAEREDVRGFHAAMRESGLDAILAVPLRDQKGVILGVLAVFGRGDDAFARRTRELMGEMAQIAFIAIEQHRLNEALRRRAHYDSLTELPNRALLADRLSQAIHDAGRGGHAVGVLLLDLDEFKLVNDSLGHDAGDQLLQEVGTRLRDCLRAGDTVARLGGDEFVMVVPIKQHGKNCTDVAERLLRALGGRVRVAGCDVHAHPSIGISIYPDDGTTPEALLQAADAAMYAAKKAGKNRYCYFNDGMDRRVSVQR